MDEPVAVQHSKRDIDDVIDEEYDDENVDVQPINNRQIVPALHDMFRLQKKRAKKLHERVKERLELINFVQDPFSLSERVKSTDTSKIGFAERLGTDRFEGDVILRTTRMLLKMIDENGFERSDHQLLFHKEFEKCVARVIYRKEWATQRPMIMKHNGWDECKSETMISTPRRFGKTFSIAIYCACISLAMGVDTVIFSPGRRPSRKILERIVEFIRILGYSSSITEYNQEQCRVRSLDGKTSLIRSFPSKVNVSFVLVPIIVSITYPPPLCLSVSLWGTIGTQQELRHGLYFI